jgi:hypothetical protein
MWETLWKSRKRAGKGCRDRGRGLVFNIKGREGGF